MTLTVDTLRSVVADLWTRDAMAASGFPGAVVGIDQRLDGRVIVRAVSPWGGEGHAPLTASPADARGVAEAMDMAIQRALRNAFEPYGRYPDTRAADEAEYLADGEGVPMRSI